MRINKMGLAAFAMLAVGPSRGTVHVRENELTVTATEDLSGAQYKLITLAGTIQQSGSLGRVAGICKFWASSGYQASAVYEGLTKAFVGAAVSTPGWGLKAANSGWLTPCLPGSLEVTIGRFIGSTAAASGDIIPIALDVTNLPGAF